METQRVFISLVTVWWNCRPREEEENAENGSARECSCRESVKKHAVQSIGCVINHLISSTVNCNVYLSIYLSIFIRCKETFEELKQMVIFNFPQDSPICLVRKGLCKHSRHILLRPRGTFGKRRVVVNVNSQFHPQWEVPQSLVYQWSSIC